MNDKLYRKKSLEKVKSPENLDDYIQVSNPGVWLLLISIIALLVGACVWGTFGRIDITKDAIVEVDDGKVVCIIDEKEVSAVQEGMIVKFDGDEAIITKVARDGKNYVCSLSADNPVLDGIYEGQLVEKRIRPLSFLLDGN